MKRKEPLNNSFKVTLTNITALVNSRDITRDLDCSGGGAKPLLWGSGHNPLKNILKATKTCIF